VSGDAFAGYAALAQVCAGLGLSWALARLGVEPAARALRRATASFAAWIVLTVLFYWLLVIYALALGAWPLAAALWRRDGLKAAALQSGLFVLQLALYVGLLILTRELFR